MSSHSSTRAAVAAVLLGCSLASAQSTEDQLPGFDLERLGTNIGRGSSLIGNGELLVPQGLSVSLMGHYQHMPLVLFDGEKELRIVSDRATTLLSASYGILPWLELGAQVPLVLWQQGDDPREAGLAPLSPQGLGTPVLQAKMALMSRRQRKVMDLSADLAVGLPIGNGTALAGDSGPRFQARLVAGAPIGWVHPSIEAGVLFRPNIPLATPGRGYKPGATSEIQLGAGATMTGTGPRAELGLRATISQQVSMDLLGGLRFPLLAGLDGYLLGGPGVGGALGTPRFRVVAGINFRTEPLPKLSFLDDKADRELQLALATPEQAKDESVRPTRTWELNSVIRDTQTLEEEQVRERLRPYQPGPEERLLLRGEILFAKGSFDLPGVEPLLDQAVLKLSEQPRGGTIIVEGHADTEDADMSNLIISLRRAQAVRRYLVSQGIPSTRVKIRGFGADWPVSVKPANEQERQLNRRTDVLVVTEREAPKATTRATAP